MYHKILIPILGTILLCTNVATAQENQWTSGRPDGHAPIGVMGDHYHKKGEFMVSLKSMTMYMDGNLQSDEEISNEEIFEEFVIAPQEMVMRMEMVGVMYAPSDRITLMASGKYVSNTMDLRTASGINFRTEGKGFGDISLGSLIKIMNRNRQSLHGNAGISIPTGSIDQRDATPMSDNAPLAYLMQLGSGTWDPSLGLTYLGQSDRFSWGAQSMYKLRLGENSEDYSLGNRFDAVGWGAIKVSDYFSFSASLRYFDLQQINGADPDLNPAIMPLFNTDNSGRSQLDAGLGVNFLIPSGNLKNLRIAAEVKLPAYQEVNGIQMENTLMSTLGIQYVIGHK